MWLLLCAVLIGIDQLIKYFTVAKLANTGTFPIINGVLHLTYVENRGMAFGMFQNGTAVLIAVTAVELAVIIYYFVKHTNRNMWVLRLSLMMITAGAIGNLLDRVFRGFVVDMFDFRLINFYVFNFADACICV
ncbi:MAG: signal peptidase II, partial [Clostridia bacterium]|nr:signal peptidase II [Clostridia bacterium]